MPFNKAHLGSLSVEARSDAEPIRSVRFMVLHCR
jgi:hypothetical protein